MFSTKQPREKKPKGGDINILKQKCNLSICLLFEKLIIKNNKMNVKNVSLEAEMRNN